MSEHVALAPEDCDETQLRQIFDHAIAPRPIALVSTIGELGRPYLHELSWYSTASVNPPIQYFAVTGQDGERGRRLLEHVRRHREFVLNAVDERVARTLGALTESGDDAGTFHAAGVHAAPSVKVVPYRVAESPAQMECRLLDVVPVADGASHLVFGAVVQFHVREDLHEQGRIDQRRYGVIGRMAEDRYCRCGDLYRMRPEEAA
jgi:flavin reductase (DIM6/NTAB) family NADH-FMN oxidoreductase RutF